MNKLKKIAGINILIIFFFNLLAQLLIHSNGYGSPYSGVGLAFTFLAFLMAQGGINLFVSLYFFLGDNSEQGKVYLLSSVIVFLVGMSSCVGNIMLLENI